MLTVGGVVTTTTYTYDPCNRVLTQSATAGGVTVQHLTYMYYSTGQVHTRTEVVAGVVTTTTYLYDPAGQVISETVVSGATTTVRTYTYDGAGNRTTATTTAGPSYPLTQVEETSPYVAYTGAWSTWSDAVLSGGSYTYANASGASATLGFHGTRLALVARKGPEFGRARVYVDGAQTGEIDLYAAVTCYQQVVFDTGVLPAGRHHVRIEWTGLKNAAATGTSIGIDAFSLTGVEAQVAVRREQEASPVAYTGTWWTWSDPVHSGGSCTYANTAGASVTTTVVGSGFALIAQTGPEFGRARVYVDGIAQDIDLYSTSNRYQQTVLTKTLPCGSHTVRVEWTGTKNPASTGTNVSFDAIDASSAAPDQTLTFDAANRVVGFTYDARGNVLADGTYTYTWDAYNHLTGVKLASTGALVATFAYDSDGMRQTATAGGVTTRFAVDAVSDEITALMSATGVVVAQFIRDAAGALMAMVRSGAVLTYLTNAHGDVTALLDSSGTVVARWTYDAWGRPTEYNAAGTHVATGTAGNPFLYAGYFFDAATGLYYLRARYYDPATGRFLSMDPEPGRMSDRLSQNPYIYCQNDPVNLADRTGRRIDAFGGTTRPTAAQQVAANKAASAARKKREAERRKAEAAKRAAVAVTLATRLGGGRGSVFGCHSSSRVTCVDARDGVSPAPRRLTEDSYSRLRAAARSGSSSAECLGCHTVRREHSGGLIAARIGSSGVTCHALPTASGETELMYWVPSGGGEILAQAGSDSGSIALGFCGTLADRGVRRGFVETYPTAGEALGFGSAGGWSHAPDAVTGSVRFLDSTAGGLGVDILLTGAAECYSCVENGDSAGTTVCNVGVECAASAAAYGAGAALGGVLAAGIAGATVGTAVPGLGTALGFVVGVGLGFAASYLVNAKSENLGGQSIKECVAGYWGPPLDGAFDAVGEWH